jgi:PAS domain S-box-containing protein
MSSNNPTQVNALRRQAFSDALWDAADVAIMVTDVQGVFVDVSDGFCTLIGYARHELVGEPFSMLLPLEHITAAMRAKDAAFQKPQYPHQSQPMRSQWILLNKAGKRVNMATSTTRVNVAGESYQVTTVKDVTALTQSYARQAELYQQLVLALRLGDIQVWRWDIVNDEVVTGDAEASGVRQADTLEYVHEDDREVLLQATDKALTAPAEPTEAFCEYRLRTPQGWQWLATTMAVTQRDRQGQPTVMLGVNRNIQDHKDRERDIGALQYKLERIISAVQAGVIEINAHGEVVYVNLEACAMLQTSPPQLLCCHYHDVPWQFFDERGQPLDAVGIPLVADTLATCQAPHDIKVSTATPHKWFNMRAQPLFDEQTGQVSGVVVSLNDITAIESSRRELVNLSGRLVNILESTTDAFFSLDRQWRFTYLNQQAERALQTSRAQLLGQRAWDYFAEADEFRRQYERVFAEQQPVTFEAHYAPLNVHFEVHAYPFSDELGVFFRDVTHRQEDRKRLLESEERFRRSFEDSPLGMVIVTPERRYIRANHNFCQMVGYAEDELIGRETRDFTYLDDKEKTAPLVAQLVAGDIASYTVEKRYQHKDGHDVWARLSVSLVRDEQGTPLYVIGQIQDLTEQFEREAAYATIVNHALQGFVLLQAGKVVLVNPAAVAMLGYTEQEMYAWQLAQQTQVIYPEDIPDFTTAVRNIVTGCMSAYQSVLRFVHRHGSVRWAEVYLSAVSYKGSTAVQLAFLDVTARQQAQDELKRALVERTVLLQEVHHRVRNNLQVIASMLNLQAKRLENIAAKQALEDSHRRILAMAAVHRALHESNDLANIDFAAYLTDFVTRLLRPKRNQVHLHLQLEPTFLSAEQAIPCALIVNELVSNALEHAFVGDINNAVDQASDDQVSDEAYIYVRLQHDDDVVTLSVADNGVGMPADSLEHDTLGMIIVQSLAGQLDTTLVIDNTCADMTRPGTTVTVTFAVSSSTL